MIEYAITAMCSTITSGLVTGIVAMSCIVGIVKIIYVQFGGK